jgi:hypothetical protein
VVKSLETKPRRLGSLVHTQDSGIKYKKPFGYVQAAEVRLSSSPAAVTFAAEPSIIRTGLMAELSWGMAIN